MKTLMSQLERQQKMMQLVQERPSISVREIADTLFFSESSVRRDIRELESRHLVSLVRGGVIPEARNNSVIPLNERDGENREEKEKIAQMAASLVKDGDTILMDSSSTVRRMTHYFGGKQNVRIITNNLKIFEELLPKSFQLYCTGGTYRSENHNFSGGAAEAYLKTVQADAVFFSSQGVSESGEISDVSEEETSLRKLMLERAKRKYFLCDATKIGIAKQFILCNVSEIDEMICNNEELKNKICFKK